MKYIRIITIGLLWLAMAQIPAMCQEVTSLNDSIRIDGNVNLRNVFYGMKGIANRRTPFSYVLSTDITISKGDFSLPFGFTISEQERGFSQPFNQFGITPSYKWAKLHLGYSTVDWNNYTISGTQFLGVAAELTPGKLRFGVLYGRFNRATPVDSIGFITNNSGLPAYQRMGTAVQLGYGSSSRNVDLTFFRGKDQVDKHSPIQKDDLTFVFPAENTSVGLRTRLDLSKAVSFKLDGGLSIYNRDLTAPLIDSTTEIGLLSVLNNMHKVRLSTSVYYGADAGFSFRIKNHNIDLITKYVLPDYKSMGVYFMDNDIFSYGFTHNFSVWKSKFNLTYGANRLNDNLLNKKPVTTFRIQPIVTMSLNPNKYWGVEANWNNFYTKQKDGNIEIADSFRINQNNPGLTITPHAQWGDTSKYYAVMLMYTKIQLVDLNPLTVINAQYTATVYGVSYSFDNSTSQTGYNLGANYTKNENSFLKEKAVGGSVGINKSFKNDKISSNGNLSYQNSNLSNTISIGFSGAYVLKQKQQLNAGLTFIHNGSKDENVPNFNEVTFTITYNKNFGYAHKKKK